MIFRLRQIEFTADGRKIVRDQDLAKAQLTIGRAAENDIHLPDLAVEALHARIERREHNRIGVEAAGTLGFALDGKVTRSAAIDCNTGAELRFGSYRISVSSDADEAVLLTIQRIAAPVDSAGRFDEKKSFSLSGIMPGRRPISWILAAAILAIFLALPIASNLTRAPGATPGVTSDASWSPGELSLAHHNLKERCVACHVRPFESVRDETCRTCHDTVHDHAPLARLAGARGDFPLGKLLLWQVAHAFGKPGPGACVDCHREHEGAGPMEPARQQFCTDCHGSLSERLTDTKLGNAGDFGKLHPQFKALVAASAGNRALARISLDARPRDPNGLTFPHKLHLDPLGGVARMAGNIGAERGYGKRLGCKDCHHPTEDGVRFMPVNMERDCQACHSLVYDRVGATFRTLRHGDIDQTIADLRAADHSQPVVSGSVIRDRHRPGNAAGSLYSVSFAPRVSREGRIAQAFSRNGVCGECHTPVISGGKWRITPVHQTSRYMSGGWFDHKAHRQTQCTACHAAEKSSASSDLLLPGIATCRTCHQGESSASAVPSSCAMCHDYHRTISAPRQAKQNKQQTT